MQGFTTTRVGRFVVSPTFAMLQMSVGAVLRRRPLGPSNGSVQAQPRDSAIEEV